MLSMPFCVLIEQWLAACVAALAYAFYLCPCCKWALPLLLELVL